MLDRMHRHLDEHDAAGVVLGRELDAVGAMLGVAATLRETGLVELLVEARVLCRAVARLCGSLERIDWRRLATLVVNVERRLATTTPYHPALFGTVMPQLRAAHAMVEAVV
jgi:hypothetical protein